MHSDIFIIYYFILCSVLNEKDEPTELYSSLECKVCILKKKLFKYVSIYCMKLRRLDKFENNYKRHYALRSHF